MIKLSASLRKGETNKLYDMIIIVYYYRVVVAVVVVGEGVYNNTGLLCNMCAGGMSIFRRWGS